MAEDKEDKFTWQKGDVEIYTLQCTKCKYLGTGETWTTCKPFPDGKPVFVVDMKADCPKFEGK